MTRIISEQENKALRRDVATHVGLRLHVYSERKRRGDKTILDIDVD